MTMYYGYVRISTAKQNIDRQIRNIKEVYPTVTIVQEVYTGTNIYNRKELNKLLKVVKTGDTIIFDSVSRMSRNAEEGFELYEKLYNKGINLVFLKEPHINTDTYKQALTNNVPLTGTNVDFILEGINTARLNGKQIGQVKGSKLTTKKSISAKEQIQKYSKDFNGTLNDTDTMKLVGISRVTYYKYKKELKKELSS